MGDWTITIRGIGAHHNPNNPSDADRMARLFTKALRDAGHTITEAGFTYGGHDMLNMQPHHGPIPAPPGYGNTGRNPTTGMPVIWGEPE